VRPLAAGHRLIGSVLRTLTSEMMALPDVTSDQSVRRAARPWPSRPEGAEGEQANDLSAVRRVPNQIAQEMPPWLPQPPCP